MLADRFVSVPGAGGGEAALDDAAEAGGDEAAVFVDCGEGHSRVERVARRDQEVVGDPEGDYNVTLSMISDTCKASSNALLKKPSTAPHPLGAVVGNPPAPATTPVLPIGSASYLKIVNWISGGCQG